MKTSKLFGSFLAAMLAMTLLFGCGSGTISGETDAAGGVSGPGDVVELETEGGGGVTLASQMASVCESNLILPEGKHAYFQLLPRQFVDNQAPFISNLLLGDIVDPEYNLPLYDNFAYADQSSNAWAMFHTIFDKKLGEQFGVSISDMCIAGNITSRLRDFCQRDPRDEGENTCFNDMMSIMENFDRIPYVGDFMMMAMMIMPENIMGLFMGLPMNVYPDPFVLMSEVIGGTELQLVIDNWEPGALPKFNAYISWLFPRMEAYSENMMRDIEAIMEGGGGEEGGGDGLEPPILDFDVNVPPPDFSLLADDVQQIPTLAPVEDEDGCYDLEWVIEEEADPTKIVGIGKQMQDWELRYCERGEFLLIATPNSMDELLARYDLYASGITEGSFIDDAMYKQTYRSLWTPEMEVPPPAFMGAANYHALQSTALAELNDDDPDEGLSSLLALKSDAEILRFGGAFLADQKSYFKIAVQFFDESGVSDSVVFSHRKQIASAGELMGYYDVRLNLGLDVSTSFRDELDMNEEETHAYELMGIIFKYLSNMMDDFAASQ